MTNCERCVQAELDKESGFDESAVKARLAQLQTDINRYQAWKSDLDTNQHQVRWRVCALV